MIDVVTTSVLEFFSGGRVMLLEEGNNNVAGRDAAIFNQLAVFGSHFTLSLYRTWLTWGSVLARVFPYQPIGPV